MTTKENGQVPDLAAEGRASAGVATKFDMQNSSFSTDSEPFGRGPMSYDEACLFVSETYETSKNRTPNSSELGFWANALVAGFATPYSAAMSISGSHRDFEFVENRASRSSESVDAQAQFATTAVSQFTKTQAVYLVTELYQLYLGRSPDTGGLNFWSDALASGNVSYETVTANISSSPEGVAYTMSLEEIVHNIYWIELGRIAEEGGLRNNVDNLRRGTSVENIRIPIHNSAEAISFRASYPPVIGQDPRFVALRDLENFTSYDAEGNATVDVRRGDSMLNISMKMYNTTTYWWVIAQANNIMRDRDFAGLQKMKIPDLRESLHNRNNVLLTPGDVEIFINSVTGDQWMKYNVPAVSLITQPSFEDNPLWLQGLAFVNGNDAYHVPAFQVSRSVPYPVMPPSYWNALKDVEVSIPDIEKPLSIDTNLLTSLPVVNGSGDGLNPPPPPVKYTPGSDPSSVVIGLRKYPEQVTSTLNMSQVKIVAVRKSIVEYFPKLRGELIGPGWGNRTWDESPGIFHEASKTVGIATDPDMKKSGSLALGDHEIGHAYDWAMGKISQGPTFEKAFLSDFAALRSASQAGYYTKPDANGGHVRAKSETYAESFANYYSGNARWFADKPALLNYFRSLPRPVQPGSR